jgi:hypothetical protein
MEHVNISQKSLTDEVKGHSITLLLVSIAYTRSMNILTQDSGERSQHKAMYLEDKDSTNHQQHVALFHTCFHRNQYPP